MYSQDVSPARILIVDDDPAQCHLLQEVFLNGGIKDLRSLTDPRHAIPTFLRFQPDLVMLDLSMPHVDGEELLQQLVHLIPDDVYLPVMVVTGYASRIITRKVLALGAHDVVAKPYDALEVLLRARNLLQARFLYKKLADLTPAPLSGGLPPRRPNGHHASVTN